MTHKDHVFLIKKAIKGNTWADFGSGWGAFTLALRDVGGENIEIYSIDKNQSSLKEQEVNFRSKFPNSRIKFLDKDFTGNLELPKLDGILMANSLHYIKDKVPFLNKIKSYLKPDGKLVMVEYNLERANTWVPYPLTYTKFDKQAKEAGFTRTNLLERVPLEWGNEMYSAEALV